jgi:diacylglycerol kinase family enzyme
VFIGNGRYTAEGMDLGGRQALDDGVLSVYVAPYCGRFDLLRIAIRALAGRLEAEPKFESFEGREVTIDAVHRHVRIALDGEIVSLTPPLVCRIRPAALRLLTPEPEPANQNQENPRT